jgi:hypothetical protein
MKKMFYLSLVFTLCFTVFPDLKPVKADTTCYGNWVQIGHLPDYSYILVECIADPYNQCNCSPCTRREWWKTSGIPTD